MGEDVSLDEFLDADESEESAGDSEADAEREEPIEPVRRRWIQDGELVCSACKSW